MVATTPGSTYSHTAVPQLASGAPYTHHSQLHLHTVRTVSQEVNRDASGRSLLQPQVVAQCFDGHLHSQKEAAGWKNRDICTCCKCTPVAVTAHSDWMQLAVAIAAEYVCMYVLSEVTHICNACNAHTSTCAGYIYLSDGKVLMHHSIHNDLNGT